MNTGNTSGISTGMDGQTFGAAVVSKTLDTMNNVSFSPAPTDASTFGAAVVSKTLDYMNSGSLGGNASFGASSGMDSSFDFQMSVLSPAYTGKGTILDSMG